MNIFSNKEILDEVVKETENGVNAPMDPLLLNEAAKELSSTPSSLQNVDYLESASKAVKPVYDAALGKVNEYFNVREEIPPSKMYSTKEQAAILGLPESEVSKINKKQIDKMVVKRRVESVAAMYPEYINNADAKSLEQFYTNPKVVIGLNNSAKARHAKSGVLERGYATNLAMGKMLLNNTDFMKGKISTDEWIMSYQVLASERDASRLNVKGSKAWNEKFQKWNAFSDESEVSFVDLMQATFTDVEGFKAALAELGNSAASIGSSVAGAAVGGTLGLLTPVPGGVAAGITAGRFFGGMLPAFDEAVSNILQTEYPLKGGGIDWKAVRADIHNVKNKIRIEATQQGILMGSSEAIAPGAAKFLGRISAKVAGRVASKATPNVAKNAAMKLKEPVIKVLNKTGRVGVLTAKVASTGAKVTGKASTEMLGEGTGAFVPKTTIDFQNGRLNKTKLGQNLSEAVQEGAIGFISGIATSPVDIGLDTLNERKKAKSIKPDAVLDADKPTSKEGKSSKPDVEAESSFDQETTNYLTYRAEEAVENIADLDEDLELVMNLEGMTPEEEIAFVDSVNSTNEVNEEGVVSEPLKTNRLVNGADLETVLGEDLPTFLAVLPQTRQVEIAAQIESGSDITFTYGEWLVGAKQVVKNHPDINHVVIHEDTGLVGYEGVDFLNEALDKAMAEFDKISNLESNPPALPTGITYVNPEGIVKAVHKTNDVNHVRVELSDGSIHDIRLSKFTTETELQGLLDNLTSQFKKALSKSGKTSPEVVRASLQGVPVMVRMLIKRATALGKPVSEVKGDIIFKSDKSHGSAYIGGNPKRKGGLVYGVGGVPQRVSTVTHEFAHVALEFMATDYPELKRQSEAGNITPEGIEYLAAMDATAKLLGLRDMGEFADLARESGILSDMTLYHGSGTDFDKFKETAINTGEGAQAYGYGLYFTTDKNVAEWYREKSNTPVSMDEIRAYYAVGDIVESYGGGYDRVVAFDDTPSGWVVSVISVDAKGNPIPGERVRSHFTVPTREKVDKKLGKNTGQLYEVQVPEGKWVDLDNVEGEALEVLNKYSTTVKGIGRLDTGVSAELSAELYAKGFNGITYIGRESGKRNYVVFSEDDIKIINKFYKKDKATRLEAPTYITLINPVTGEVQTRNQSKKLLTNYTVIHEKLATTMEVFLKTGKLETEKMTAEAAKIFIYWRGLIPSDVVDRLASVAAVKGWKYSGEYHQALDPSDEVSNVFNNIYAVNQELESTVTPFFNISFFPSEMLGKDSKRILEKVVEAKHTAIAKAWAKIYGDAINARTEIGKPEVVKQMNEDLAAALKDTNAGAFLEVLTAMGLSLPEGYDPRMQAALDFVGKYGETPALPETRVATEEDLELALSNFPDLTATTASTLDSLTIVLDTFEDAKQAVYDATLVELGYPLDGDIKAASEEMLSRELPAILEDQLRVLVELDPEAAKGLFSAYINKGKVSNRIVNRQVNQEAIDRVNKLNAKTFKTSTLNKEAVDPVSLTVKHFKEGRYLEALASAFESAIKGAMLTRGIQIANKLKKAKPTVNKETGEFGVPDKLRLSYQRSNEGKVHPEILDFARGVYLQLVSPESANLEGLIDTPIENTPSDIDVLVRQTAASTIRAMEGVDPNTVQGVLTLYDFIEDIDSISRAAMKAEMDAVIRARKEVGEVAMREILNSKRVWDMRHGFQKGKANKNALSRQLNKLTPQVLGVHEVFSPYFKSENDYYASGVNKIINNVINMESLAINEGIKDIKHLKPFADKAYGEGKKWPSGGIKLTNTGIQLDSRDQALGALMLFGSESGRKTMLRTLKAVKQDPATNTDILKVEEFKQDIAELFDNKHLTDADVVFVNEMFKTFAKLLPMIKEVYRRDKGIAVGTIEAVPFSIAGKNFDGGYFPITYLEKNKSTDAGSNTFKFYDVFNIRDTKRIEERGEGKKTPVRLDLDSVTAYINMAYREYHIKPALNVFKAFIEIPEVNEHIQTTRPGALEAPVVQGGSVTQTGILNDWIDSVDNQIRGSIDPNSAGIWDLLLNNTPLVFYSADILAGVVNLAAGLPVTATHSNSRARLALHTVTFLLQVGKYRERTKLSQQQIANDQTFEEFVRGLDSEEIYSGSSKANDFLKKVSMAAMRYSQWLLEKIAWNSEYEYWTAKGLSQEDAVARADNYVSRTVGRRTVSSTAIGQKGTLNRIINVAALHLIVEQRKARVELNRDSPLYRKMLMGVGIIAGITTSIVANIGLNDLFTPDRDDDDDEEVKKLKMALQGASETLPYVLGGIGRMFSTLINSQFGSDLSITPLENSVKRGIRAAKHIPVYVFTDYKMGARDYADVFALTTLITGVPFSSISNAYDVVIFAEKLDDPRKLTDSIQDKNEERRDAKSEFYDNLQDRLLY